ncbi:MerR family transcriptional regulator [Sphingomonas ginsenosidivorax]|uniref:MerR family transcriptional regulator n=1 Tax=Sphingomonas ginsenosidivorax TaxID=862135 RepID=A0A5C6U577_9SPHN|nr:MerR family DNA-binding protein [Sphingomonas ginsenosidivorax]TXC68002.1 MerR family transcriptional regulator [Sphingomonas ginsenosidivorax]
MTGMTIAGLAREGDVGVETIRYYQRRRLLETPDRPNNSGSGGGIRRYGSEDVRRLRFIRSAQGAGFTLEEIGELLELDATDDRVRARELANKRVAALDAKIDELKRVRSSLHRLARECGAGSEGPCPILTAFEPD